MESSGFKVAVSLEVWNLSFDFRSARVNLRLTVSSEVHIFFDSFLFRPIHPFLMLRLFRMHATSCLIILQVFKPTLIDCRMATPEGIFLLGTTQPEWIARNSALSVAIGLSVQVLPIGSTLAIRADPAACSVRCVLTYSASHFEVTFVLTIVISIVDIASQGSLSLFCGRLRSSTFVAQDFKSSTDGITQRDIE